jgi:hypothetical protein
MVTDKVWNTPKDYLTKHNRAMQLVLHTSMGVPICVCVCVLNINTSFPIIDPIPE